MQLQTLTVEIFEEKEREYGHGEAWGILDRERHGSFCPGASRRLRGTLSDDGDYIVGWAEQQKVNFGGQSEPPGVCLIKSNQVILTFEIEGIYKAVTANDGTIAAIGDRGDRLVIFGSQGETLVQEDFGSNVSAISISPDGDHAAVATAFPDNAVHLYRARDGRYLGRTENLGTSVIGYLRFSGQGEEKFIETYEIRPDSDMDVVPERKEVIDTIPVGTQIDASAMDGLGVVLNADESRFHYIPSRELEGVGTVRLPGVKLEAACGQELEPINADLIYEDFPEAIKSDFEFCDRCQAVSAVYPQVKTERTFDYQ